MVFAERLRLAPAIPARRISRPTRFGFTRSPEACRFGVDARTPVHFAVGAPDLLDPLAQLRISSSSCRRTAPHPRVVAAGGEDPAPDTWCLPARRPDSRSRTGIPPGGSRRSPVRTKPPLALGRHAPSRSLCATQLRMDPPKARTREPIRPASCQTSPARPPAGGTQVGRLGSFSPW